LRLYTNCNFKGITRTRGVKGFVEVRSGLYCREINGWAVFGKNSKLVVIKDKNKWFYGAL